MRIVHVFKDAYPPLAAGITRYISMISTASAVQGHDVEVLVAGTRHTRREQLRPGLHITRCREYGRLLSTPLSPALVSNVHQIDADVIHLHMPNPVGEIGVLGNRTPVAVTFHARLGRQGFLYPIYAPLQRKIFEQCSRILVASPAMAVDPDLRSHRKKVLMLPFPIDSRLVGDRDRRRTEEQRSAEGLRLIFVGRLVYYKGLDVLFDAMSGLDEVHLTVVGEGPLRESLDARLATDPSLSTKVSMLGGISDAALAEQYRLNDVFVAPSVSQAEAFGIAMAEGLANGLPAISTALGTGTDWVNEDEVSGLVVPPNDAQALRAAIVQLADAATYRRLSAGASAIAQERYMEAPHFAAIEAMYQEVRR